MTTEIVKQIKERIQEYEQGTLFQDRGIETTVSGKSGDGTRRRNNPNKRPTTKQDDAELWEQKSDKGIVKAFTRQISFDGIEYFQTIFLPLNSHLWPKLSKRRKGSEEAHKKGIRLVK